MKIALIIVNYNSGGLLGKCLSAVHRQTRMPDRIVVVDNASTDGSASGVEGEWDQVQLVRMTTNAGFSAANNRAFGLCEDCDWVALLNPDAFPSPGWLAALAGATVEYPQAGSFASCLVKDSDASVLDGAGDAYHVSGLVWRIGHGEKTPSRQRRQQVFSACAAAAMYRCAAVQSVGGFDESYFCYNEDVDLGFRLRLIGMPCWYIPEAVVTHVGSATTGTHSDFSLFYGHRNLVWTYVKNMPGPLFFRFLWQHLLLNLVSIVFLSLRYRTTAVVRAKYSAIKGLRAVLRKRRQVQAHKTCDDGDLLAVVTKGWWRCYVRQAFLDVP